VNTYKKGREGEDQAAVFLKNLGIEIIKRNFKCPAGEVDIIGVKGNILKFVEVKRWDAHPFSEMEHAVNRKKQNRIIGASKFFLRGNRRYTDYSIQYDVFWISGEGKEITYIEGAFTETGAA
jgi:putative endonuclease